MLNKNILLNGVLSGIVGLTLFLTGCGGGSGSGVSPNPNPNPNPQTGNFFKYNRISIAGSSITHGDIENSANEGEGYLGEKSYVGEVEKYFREERADTIGPDELVNAKETDDEPMSYQGKIKVYGSGTVLQGTLKASDTISIVYAGSNVKTTIEMDVDGQKFEYTIPAGIYLPVKKTFDDTNVNFYKAFRENNPKAVKTWKLSKNEKHTFTLTVKEGELHLNFITNHMYYFQNAGVGGFEALDFLSENRQHSTVNDIIAFDPDLFIFESSTNDAKTWATEIALRNGTSGEAPSTNQWILEEPVVFQSNGMNITLNQAVSVQKGDVVIMGDYNGDIQNMAVGIVLSNSNRRDISLAKIISYAGQNVTEVNAVPQNIVEKCRIKRIRIWEDRVKEVIQKVQNGVGHKITVGIGTSGVPNYYDPEKGDPYTQQPFTPRRLLGYRERGQEIASENGWFFVDFFKRILKVEPGVDVDHKWTYGDNTHPNDPGRVYFGEAVISALQPYLK